MIPYTTLSAFVVVGATLIYGFFVSDTFRNPPHIAVKSPSQAHVSGPVRVTGTVTGAREFYINDRKTHTEESGLFSVVLTPPVGYTVIELLARDAHKRETYTHIPLIVTGYENSKKEQNNGDEE